MFSTNSQLSFLSHICHCSKTSEAAADLALILAETENGSFSMIKPAMVTRDHSRLPGGNSAQMRTLAKVLLIIPMAAD